MSTGDIIQYSTQYFDVNTAGDYYYYYPNTDYWSQNTPDDNISWKGTITINNPSLDDTWLNVDNGKMMFFYEGEAYELVKKGDYLIFKKVKKEEEKEKHLEDDLFNI